MLSVTQPPRSTMDRTPSPYDTPRPPKSYFGEAVLTLAIYYFGMLIGGFFANLYFLRRAREDREEGIPTKYVGCLHALLLFHIALAAAIGVGVVYLLVTGQLAAMFSG